MIHDIRRPKRVFLNQLELVSSRLAEVVGCLETVEGELLHAGAALGDHRLQVAIAAERVRPGFSERRGFLASIFSLGSCLGSGLTSATGGGFDSLSPFFFASSFF